MQQNCGRNTPIEPAGFIKQKGSKEKAERPKGERPKGKRPKEKSILISNRNDTMHHISNRNDTMLKNCNRN
jgi:hypothetical protein